MFKIKRKKELDDDGRYDPVPCNIEAEHAEWMKDPEYRTAYEALGKRSDSRKPNDEDQYDPVGGHDEMVAEWMKDPEFRAEREKLQSEFAVLDAFLDARKRNGITQEEIAKRMGTSRSAVARMESPGNKHSPSLRTLQRYAKALECRLELKFIPLRAVQRS